MNILYVPDTKVEELPEKTGLLVLRESKTNPQKPIPSHEDSICINFTNIDDEWGENISEDDIFKFVNWIQKRYRDNIGINCENFSQGAAFARFLSSIYKLDFPYDINYYNISIYAKLLKEYDKQTR